MIFTNPAAILENSKRGRPRKFPAIPLAHSPQIFLNPQQHLLDKNIILLISMGCYFCCLGCLCISTHFLFNFPVLSYICINFVQYPLIVSPLYPHQLYNLRWFGLFLLLGRSALFLYILVLCKFIEECIPTCVRDNFL